MKHPSIGFIIFIVIIGSLVGSWFIYGTYGVNVDDSYIYFSYIRNAVRHGEMAYNSGDPTFGATSLLWVMTVGLLHIITGLDLLQLVKYWGIACHITGAVFLFLVTRKLIRFYSIAALVAFAYLLNPFLLASSVSGLETPMNIAVIMICLYRLISTRFAMTFTNGLLLGISFWSRPENLMFAGFFMVSAGVLEWYRTRALDRRIMLSGMKMAAGFLAVAAPWSGYVFVHSGQIIPSTYKGLIYFFSPDFFQAGLSGRCQTAGHVLTDLFRKLTKAKFQALYSPFLIFSIATPLICLVSAVRRRFHPVLLLMGYTILFFSVCIFQFPITMWRYILPIIPIFYLTGGVITAELIELIPRKYRTAHLPRLLLYLIVAGSLGIWGWSWRGQIKTARNIFHEDVARIVDMQNPRGTLAAAHWIRSNTAPAARIAAIGIGVVGYFSERYLLDLGGLIDPGVWPALSKRNPEMARHILEQYGVDYFLYENINIWGALPATYPGMFTVAARIPQHDPALPPLIIYRFDATADPGQPSLKIPDTSPDTPGPYGMLNNPATSYQRE